MKLQGRRILLVEDDYLIATDLARAFAGAGADIAGPVPSVEEALAVLQEEPLDGAVLDIDLQGETVFPVADALTRRRIPFVFATGYDAAAVIPPTYDGAPRCEKPVEPAMLARLLFAGAFSRTESPEA